MEDGGVGFWLTISYDDMRRRDKGAELRCRPDMDYVRHLES
jgi:hypothetical protein